VSHTFSEQVTLIKLDCPACGVTFAMPELLRQNRIDKGGNFWCPNGHSLDYGESTVAKLRKQLESAKIGAIHEADQRRAAERSAAAARGQVTKLKNRAAAGICPCCKRHFVNLERHMGTKHPDFTKDGAS
jgi:ssDNA-binding Zn-finger/Zn-ribbon topoisomerase 1